VVPFSIIKIRQGGPLLDYQKQQNGLESEDTPLGALMWLSTQLIVQEALEKETTERLERGALLLSVDELSPR